MSVADFIPKLEFLEGRPQIIGTFLNPLPLLFKALLHGQKDCVFFSGHLKCIGQQERFRAFMTARDI
jgi:hypothetical protein